MKSAGQQGQIVIIIPGGLLAPSWHADPECPVPNPGYMGSEPKYRFIRALVSRRP